MKIAAGFLFAITLAVTACAPVADETASPTETGAPAGMSLSDAADCAAAGGSWSRQGRLGQPMCVLSYADAGQSCTDGDQCQGDCRLPDGQRAGINSGPVTGVCQATSSPFGCFTRVEDGRAAATLCVD